MKRLVGIFLLCVLFMSCRAGPVSSPATPSPVSSADHSTPRAIPSTWTATPATADAVLAPTPAVPSIAAVSTPDYWPTDGWRTTSPESQGMDPDPLEQLFKIIEKKSLAVDGVVVIRNGYVVAETYYGSNTQETPHQLYSCTKSFISALVGIAVDLGYLPEGVHQRVLEFFPDKTFANSDPRKDAMTLEHLLTMSSGLDWQEGDPIYQQMWRSRDWVKFVLDRPMADDPGAEFNYNSGVSHVLSGLIWQGSGTMTQKFAQERLFTPLGITNPRWDKDADGLAIGGWGLALTPRNMAKLGFLYLHEGVWDGQQVVPAEWVKASTTAHIETGGDLNYGYQWWIYPDGSAYTALGRYGQIIFVAPASSLVVVFTARNEGGADPLLDLIDTYILPAVQND